MREKLIWALTILVVLLLAVAYKRALAGYFALIIVASFLVASPTVIVVYPIAAKYGTGPTGFYHNWYVLAWVFLPLPYVAVLPAVWWDQHKKKTLRD